MAAVAAVGTSIGQYQVSALNEKEAALDARELVVEAKEEESRLRERNKNLEKQAADLAALISQSTSQISALKDEIRSANNELLKLAEQRNIGDAQIAELEKSAAERVDRAESILAVAQERNAEVELRNLVWQMNSDAKVERLAAVNTLINTHGGNPIAVSLAIELISVPQVESLSASGRINVLVFLRNTIASGWTADSLLAADLALDEIRDRAESGKSYIGPQTNDALITLRAHLAEVAGIT